MAAKIAVSAWSFHDALYAGRMTQYEIPYACAQLGFEDVELNDLFWPPPRWSRLRYLPWRMAGWLQGRDTWPAFERSWVSSRHTRQRLATICRLVGVHCVAFTLNSDFTADSPAAQRAALAYVRSGLATTHALGAALMRVTSDRREKSDNLNAGAVERVIAGLKRAVVAARAAGVRLALENHWGLTSEPDVMYRMVREVDSPWLGVCLDLANFPAEQRLAGIELLAPYAIHAHVKAVTVDGGAGEAARDRIPELAVLHAAGYGGALVIEYEGQGDPAEGICQTRDLLQAHWPL